MESLQQIIDSANDLLWSYIMIAALLLCAAYFTLRSGFVQFRMIGEMFRQLINSTERRRDEGVKHISPFEAFVVSLASRVGTGNLAGVATAVAVGGPGAVFWMWIIALLGAANAFVESTLAQLYKRRSADSYIGGPAYYIEWGLKCRPMAILFSVLTIVTFGFAFNTVQSNTLCEAVENAFGIDRLYIGIAITVSTLIIIFGGIQRIAKVSSVVVPVMAVGYILLAFVVVAMNIGSLPEVLKTIINSAFGVEQVVGGGMGAAVMQGIKRGLFSNEAGMGSAPNAAATASTSHPVKQGLIQTLGVFTDTLIICSCTAFIILASGVELGGELDGVRLTQEALTSQIGITGRIFVAVAIFFFAFSSIFGNYYYGEANVRFITSSRRVLNIYRIIVGAMVMGGAMMSLKMVWSLADLTMGLMTLCNIVALVLLGRQALLLLDDYRRQKREGKDPVFEKRAIKELAENDNIECW
ncbi:MAG: alanine:cation symporter family protein [Alistipes sp.]|nr:alanine:cation symporter family protein [Alistipes sp.]MBR7115347.1 alanine:cation symporter family protein [Alistipes sp.]